MTEEPVQSLWIADRLSVLQQLSLRSFLSHGHPVHLYVYSEPKGVPAGVTLLDANRILPESEIFTYESGGRGIGSVSAFSNFFRYKLLLELGGWWVDCDVVCLKRFRFDRDVVLCSEVTRTGEVTAGSCVIRAARGSESIQHCWDICCSKNRKELVWGEVGPSLVQDMIETYDLSAFVMPPETFCPFAFFEVDQMIDPAVGAEKITDETHAIHLFGRMWEDEGLDISKQHPTGCMIEDLKARYLGG